MPWPLCPGERHLVPIAQEAGWALGPVLTRREYLASTRVHPACIKSLYQLHYAALLVWLVSLPIHMLSHVSAVVF